MASAVTPIRVDPSAGARRLATDPSQRYGDRVSTIRTRHPGLILSLASEKVGINEVFAHHSQRPFSFRLHRPARRGGFPQAASSPTSPEGETRDTEKPKAEKPPSAMSSLEKAAAYRKEKAAAKSAGSAFDRAAMYRKNKPEGDDASARNLASRVPKPLNVPPGKLPDVEIVRGKSWAPTTRANNLAGVDLDSTRQIPPSLEDEVKPSEAGAGSDGFRKTNDSSPDPRVAGPQKLESTVVSLADLDLGKAADEQANELAAMLWASRDSADSRPPAATASGPSEAPASTVPPSATTEGGRKPTVVEIITRDGVITRTVESPPEGYAGKQLKSDGRVSQKDFIGLDFSDKKSSGTPAGLWAAADLPSGPLPQVEIITKDAGVAGAVDTSEADLYKPKVSTWGVFPRPRDISRTYGGGRTIRPGESLESEEERLEREARTRKLLEDYQRSMGLSISPATRAACDKAMANGDLLLDRGRLGEALLEFEEVTKQTVFKSELHGKAALQMAVCMDAMARSEEAKALYEKLASHPNDYVRRKSRQLLFGFEAANNLRVRGGTSWDSSAYRRYFDAFADGYNTTYKASEDDGNDKFFDQALPYALLLILPIALVFLAAALKR